MNWRGSTTVRERIYAALPYLLILYNSISLFDSILKQFPSLRSQVLPIWVNIKLLDQPLLSLIAFFALFFFVIRNEKIKHFIRFNAMQALLLTLLLFVLQLIVQLLKGNLAALAFIFTGINIFIGLTIIITFTFLVVQTLRGLYAELPSISEAVYLQVP